MKKKVQLTHIKAALTEEEYSNMLQAARHANSREITDGFSASAARREYNKVLSLLAFLIEHKDSYVRGTAKNILAMAKKNSQKGLFDHEGKTVFLID
jgi:hypothetical protein